MRSIFKRWNRWSIAPLVLATSGIASAHPGHADGVLSGLTHPLLGADHLLAMVAVGLWAWQLGGRAKWQVPASFVALMSVAAIAGMAGFALPMVESGIAASLLVLGLLIAFSVRTGAVFGAGTVALFALFHGSAHGVEMPLDATAWQYGLGFVLATVGLHGIGLLLGKGMARQGWMVRGAGVAIAGSGAWLMVG